MPEKDLIADRKGVGCAILFALPFAGAGVVLGWFALSSIIEWRAAVNWVETPCVVHESNLEKQRGEDSDTFKATARYSYLWKGDEFESTRVALNTESDNIGSYQRERSRELKQITLVNGAVNLTHDLIVPMFAHAS